MMKWNFQFIEQNGQLKLLEINPRISSSTAIRCLFGYNECEMGVISDIHGNYEALKAVLNYLDKVGIEEIYCLGDVVGYYSQVNECCNALRKRNVTCIMGNHDWYMAADSHCPRSKSVNDCLSFQRKVITSENREWIKSLPLYIHNHIGSMVHGGWTNPVDEYLVPTEEYFDRMPDDRYFSGHSHVQQLYQYGETVYCNPGSVGQPRDGDWRAAFAILNGTDIQLIRVPYDVDKVGELMEEHGFSGYYYEGLRVGAKTLGFYS